MRLSPRFSLTASILAVTAATLPAAGAAQTSVQAEQGDNVADVAPRGSTFAERAEDIVVTGSRIRRPDFETPSPMISLSSDTLQSSGSTNLTDILSGYPALIGSATSADTSGDDAGIGTTGLNLLNLRNLGTQRTLVLVDGRRHVSGLPGDQSVDINTIPTDLVERVDVLTGGVSAIYGADAVTGVVNFVLKKNFDGLTARGQAGISEFGDAGQRFLSITAGRNFAGGRGNVAVAFEYGKEDRLESRDRRRLSGTNAVQFRLNPDDPENVDPDFAGGNDNGIPDNVPLKDVRYFDTNREGGIDVNFDGFPDYFVGRGGGVVAFDPGRFVPNAYQQGGNATLLSDYANDLLPSVERYIVNTLGHFDVSGSLTLFAEAKFAKIKSFTLQQPTFDYYLFVEPDNPFIPAELRPEIQANGGALLNRDNFDFGQQGEAIDRETFRTVLGARGDVTSNINYEVSYVFGQTKVTSRNVNDTFDDRFYAALDVVDGPNGPTCRANIDPNWVPNQPFVSFYSDPPLRAVTPPTTFAPGQCVPLNLFGEGAPSQQALDFIRTQTTDHSKIDQHVVTAVLSGDLGNLLTLPGGPIGFALGAEYRKEKSSYVSDPIARQGLTHTNAINPTSADFDVKEVFGEVRIPVLKDVPMAHRLEVGGAIRLSDYSTIGSTTTWKVDGTYAPVRDIAFNATYSQAVRAPNISELFDAGGETFEFITDPCNSNEIQNGTEHRAANCAALLSSLGVADPGGFRDTRSTNIQGFQGGNSDLREETAKTWTAGVVLQPRMLRGLTVRADWYDIKLKNAINYVQPEQAAQLCVDQPDLVNVFCGLIARQNGGPNAGQIVDFTIVPQNVAAFRTAGLDFNLNYRFDAGKIGKFNLNLVGNYLDRLEFVGTPGAPVTNERQEKFAPKYQATLDLTWQQGPLTLNYGLSWFDKTLRFTNQEVAGNPDIVAPEFLFYKERWVHDIYMSVDVTDGFQFYGGINNFTGERPDIGVDSYPVSSVGRFFFAGARVRLPR
jgi:iron complex outermembrane receptor protein